jgi:hypothetical protein
MIWSAGKSVFTDAKETGEDTTTGTSGNKLTGTILDNQSSPQPIEGADVYLCRKKIAFIQPLLIFKDASTSSDKISSNKFPIATYELLEHKTNHPDSQSDYMHVRWKNIPPFEDGSGWICSRWNDERYADNVFVRDDAPSATSGSGGTFSIDLPQGEEVKVRSVKEGYLDGSSADTVTSPATCQLKMEKVLRTVREADVIAMLSHFKGFGYVLDGEKASFPPVYTSAYLGYSVKHDIKYNNCSTFSCALLLKPWKDKFGSAFGWQFPRDHNKWMIVSIDASTRMEVYDGAIDNGMGDVLQKKNSSADSDDVHPGTWTLVQGYSGSGCNGHSFIIADYYKQDDKVLILESNGNTDNDLHAPNDSATNGPHGPRFRNIGHIDDLEGNPDKYSPGHAWHRKKSMGTWSQIKGSYPNRVMIRLWINDLSLFI